MDVPLVVCSALRIDRRFTPVVRDLTFAFDRGVLGVMGPNGAGKTTLLRVIAENARFAGGSLTVAGVPLGTRAGADLVRRTVGYQPQKPSFVPHFSVIENLRYAAWLKGITRREQASRIPELAETLHLTDVMSRRARVLSGGEAKRLSIGMALVHRPALVVLDEPTAALDPEEHESILAVIRRVAGSTSVMFSSHDPADIAGACDGVLVIAKGGARFTGRLDELTAEGTRSVIDGYRTVMAR